jgi:predicted enzyme related to lactoylglutathione lyase
MDEAIEATEATEATGAVGAIGAIGRIDEVVVDCLDPAALATFWGRVLGTEPAVRNPAWVTLRDPDTGVTVAFQGVPEPKRGKNRLHLDVQVADMATATTDCVALRATVVGPVVEDEHGWFQVMLDPEGHEFCLVISRPEATSLT